MKDETIFDRQSECGFSHRLSANLEAEENRWDRRCDRSTQWILRARRGVEEETKIEKREKREISRWSVVQTERKEGETKWTVCDHERGASLRFTDPLLLRFVSPVEPIARRIARGGRVQGKRKIQQRGKVTGAWRFGATEKKNIYI